MAQRERNVRTEAANNTSLQAACYSLHHFKDTLNLYKLKVQKFK